MDIQRTPGFTTDTHYWSLVNIGDATGARWYHYDATRLLNSYGPDGCLITDKQLFAYNKYINLTFYAYDQSQYPISSTHIISPSNVLERYF